MKQPIRPRLVLLGLAALVLPVVLGFVTYVMTQRSLGSSAGVDPVPAGTVSVTTRPAPATTRPSATTAPPAATTAPGCEPGDDRCNPGGSGDDGGHRQRGRGKGGGGGDD
jgi:hypothetical protein